MKKLYIVLLTLPVIAYSVDSVEQPPHPSTRAHKRRRLNDAEEHSNEQRSENTENPICLANGELPLIQDLPFGDLSFSLDDPPFEDLLFDDLFEDLLFDDLFEDLFEDLSFSPLETTPTVSSSKAGTSSKSIIDNNSELEEFIRQSIKEEWWSASKIAREWNEQHPDQPISHVSIGRWLKKNMPNLYHNSTIIDNNPELRNFITQNKEWSASKIAKEWNEEHPDQPISHASIGRWLKKNMSNLYHNSTNKIDNNPELQNFITQNIKKLWGIKKIAREWNEQHPDQTISYGSIQNWLKKNMPNLYHNSKSIIDNNHELKDFITQKIKEGWGARKIAKEWNEEHPDQTISHASIGNWLKENMPNLNHDSTNNSTNKIDNNHELKDFITQKIKEGWSARKIAKEWNAQDPDQTISYTSIGSWRKKYAQPES